MGKMTEKLRSMFEVSDTDEEYEEELEKQEPKEEIYEEEIKYQEEKPKVSYRNNVNNMKPSNITDINELRNQQRKEAKISKRAKVEIVKPQSLKDAQRVTHYLRAGKMVIINAEGIDVDTAQRIMDFVGGACYAIDGSLEAISSTIFAVAPSNVEISMDAIRNEIKENEMVAPTFRQM